MTGLEMAVLGIVLYAIGSIGVGTILGRIINGN